jgi:hypothetical protein
MTDRLKGCTVTFEHEIRDDDAEPILEAIRQLRGVADVTPAIMTADDYFVIRRVRRELQDKLLAVLSD